MINNQELWKEWLESVRQLVPVATEDEVIQGVGKSVITKMLHSQCKEFITGTRVLDNVKRGKSIDADVALRLKLKSHAIEKQIPI